MPSRRLSRWFRIVAMTACASPLAAHADLWAYVDAQGRSHLADHRVDDRYRLFFKGPTTLDVPNGPGKERSQAIEALAGTRLYTRATDPALVRKYSALIETDAHASDLDPALVQAVVAVESGFDPHAVSDKGAVGLMQVLPGTAERYGVAADRRRSVADKLLDPALNVRIGTHYLRDLLARFDGDVALALAAYNAGEGAVAHHANRIPPYDETRTYVTRVRQFYAIYRPPPAASTGRVQLVKRARSLEDSASD
ncbi:MAG TPA: lytic transglycosylase domain-containing protein [Casimicrobiaceae bacterium]|nr:lytic transglycosylase domain-containing protein [Casimicrobiaceae bacterium]